MINNKGYRLNVGIILVNSEGKVFWGKRFGSKDAWQFPQGGVQSYETLEETMYRELEEEVGLAASDVEILAVTKHWLYYHLPVHLRRRSRPLCIGQKQRWFLLRLLSGDAAIKLDAEDSPEFDGWRWEEYWYPVDHVISFKRQIYHKALQEFVPVMEEYSGTQKLDKIL